MKKKQFLLPYDTKNMQLFIQFVKQINLQYQIPKFCDQLLSLQWNNAISEQNMRAD